MLVQGETSVGKTSLITYLSKLTGHVCHRVNNHEATDIQEYIGSYVHETSGDSMSKLVFKEGLLAQAMRHGHWIILDELNLAPTDILEALNRVLDDNRELFIVETQTTIKAHPMFRLFATQNPPGLYGGRKILSRALRNRFIELHFNPIPNAELVEILDECCKVPKSKGSKMVEAMRRLQTESQELDVTHSKRNYISLRDLFRWARRVGQEHDKSDRFFDWDRTMVEEGYLLLTGKARSEDEVRLVARVLTAVFRLDGSGIQLNDEWFYAATGGSHIARDILASCAGQLSSLSAYAYIEWTYDFRRLAVLLIRALQCSEPALLIGHTGCGKTTICQLAAALLNGDQQLLSINCHMHTEASDFLGGLRPAATSSENDSNQRLFQWVDGPLVVAMKAGNMFLVDEISLADDSVLERLNSVLESDRKLTLVENSESDQPNQSMEIVADKRFQLVATMNPGGDFGKKELSPALRNRFTEIWCPSDSWHSTASGFDDWVRIAAGNLVASGEHCNQAVATVIVEFLRFVHGDTATIERTKSVITIRDLLSWVNFINTTMAGGHASLHEAIVHGAYLVIIDSISDSNGQRGYERRLVETLNGGIGRWLPGIAQEGGQEVDYQLTAPNGSSVGIRPFFIELGPLADRELLATLNDGQRLQYSFTSKTTGHNLYRLLRALQIGKKPVLLEGSPGVGKTSLVR